MQLSSKPQRAWNVRFPMHGASIQRGIRRPMSTMSRMSTTPRGQKEEGSISSLFASLSGEASSVFPSRFLDLKRVLWRDEMIQSWRDVLADLEAAVEELSNRKSEMIPRIPYQSFRRGLSQQQIAEVKRVGTVIITGAVQKEEALSWKRSILDYAAENQTRLRGYPPDNIQVFELYNSPSQTQARTHPAIVETQKALLSLWHADPSAGISLDTPISYFDRLRIRQPGDSKFALGPHVDGGSIERWEDPQYRTCYEKIFQGGSNWRNHDPFDVTPRIHANQDLYNTSNQCSIFRPWQGWTSMSSTGPNEGTLRVLPFLSLTCAYMMLRPFFRPRSANSESLKSEDWEVDTTSAFPGTGLGGAQEFTEKTHPHLRLDKMMVSIPRVEPGDQVYWHCDVIHAVEAQHNGMSDSSVLYIPAVPLTLHNANYLRDQRSNFMSGLPAPDFPGGEGESKFVGRATIHDLKTFEGRRMFGFEDIDGISNVDFANKVNQVLFD